MKLSAVVLTKNEERNIIDCLETLDFCDEIIIVDDKSSDHTIELIENFKNKFKNISVYTRELGKDFSKQREFGVQKSSNDWILFIDADERIPQELAQEIQEQLSLPKVSGFMIRRTDFMWGKELKHGDPGNTRLLRLFNRTKGGLKGKVHEIWVTGEEVAYLMNPIIHYPHPTISEFLKEINFYSDLRSEELYAGHRKANLISVIAYPKAKFIKNYFFKLGILDGNPGLVHAALMSFYSFLVRSKLWLLWQKNNSV